MPELHFRVRWPDGSEELCYSPSTVVKDHYEVGKSYSLSEFKKISQLALRTASDRVKAVHGFSCSSALGQLARIEARLVSFENQEGGKVTFIGYER